MKIISILAAAGLMIGMASCGSKTVKTEQAPEIAETLPDGPKPQPVFSIFDNTGRDGCQIYRNADRIASIALDSGRCIIGMMAYKGNCYTLMSRYERDSAVMPAEIFKNGHPAMKFLPEFRAVAFDMSDGHFYTLGLMDSTDITVYRDGVRAISMPLSAGNPSAVGVLGQDIYVAHQPSDSSVVITRNGKRLMDIPGKLEDFKVSPSGCFTLAGGALYLDTMKIMGHAAYKYSGADLYADPASISVYGSNCYISASSAKDSATHYASVFMNGEPLHTFLPDSSLVEDAAPQTFCAGVAACESGVYSAVFQTDSVGSADNPPCYQFYLNSQEAFRISFGGSSARMLFVESSKL